MKNSNSQIYTISPISLMASIVSAAENSVNHDYGMEAENMVKYYSDSDSDSIVAVCEPLCVEMMKEEDNIILLNFLHSEFGTISSYSVHKFNDETSLYKLESSKGIFKMVLVLDSESRVSAIDFVKVELCEMSLAA